MQDEKSSEDCLCSRVNTPNTTDSVEMNLSKLQETVKDREACSPWGCEELDMTEQLNSTLKNDYDSKYYVYFTTIKKFFNFKTISIAQLKYVSVISHFERMNITFPV